MHINYRAGHGRDAPQRRCVFCNIVHDPLIMHIFVNAMTIGEEWFGVGVRVLSLRLNIDRCRKIRQGFS